MSLEPESWGRQSLLLVLVANRFDVCAQLSQLGVVTSEAAHKVVVFDLGIRGVARLAFFADIHFPLLDGVVSVDAALNALVFIGNFKRTVDSGICREALTARCHRRARRGLISANFLFACGGLSFIEVRRQGSRFVVERDFETAKSGFVLGFKQAQLLGAPKMPVDRVTAILRCGFEGLVGLAMKNSDRTERIEVHGSIGSIMATPFETAAFGLGPNFAVDPSVFETQIRRSLGLTEGCGLEGLALFVKRGLREDPTAPVFLSKA